jgi:hypothetical protein
MPLTACRLYPQSLVQLKQIAPACGANAAPRGRPLPCRGLQSGRAALALQQRSARAGTSASSGTTHASPCRRAQRCAPKPAACPACTAPGVGSAASHRLDLRPKHRMREAGAAAGLPCQTHPKIWPASSVKSHGRPRLALQQQPPRLQHIASAASAT